MSRSEKAVKSAISIPLVPHYHYRECLLTSTVCLRYSRPTKILARWKYILYRPKFLAWWKYILYRPKFLARWKYILEQTLLILDGWI